MLRQTHVASTVFTRSKPDGTSWKVPVLNPKISPAGRTMSLPLRFTNHKLPKEVKTIWIWGSRARTPQPSGLKDELMCDVGITPMEK